jgi:hypothetical protein
MVQKQQAAPIIDFWLASLATSYSVRKMKLNMLEVIFAICFTVQNVWRSHFWSWPMYNNIPNDNKTSNNNRNGEQLIHIHHSLWLLKYITLSDLTIWTSTTEFISNWRPFCKNLTLEHIKKKKKMSILEVPLNHTPLAVPSIVTGEFNIDKKTLASSELTFFFFF